MWGATKQITFQKFNVLHELSALLAPHSHTQGPTGPESLSEGDNKRIAPYILCLVRALGQLGARELSSLAKSPERATDELQS